MNNNRYIITRKIEAYPAVSSNEERKEIYGILRNWSNKSYRLANEIIQTLYVNENIVEHAAMRNEKYHSQLMSFKSQYHIAKDKKERTAITKAKNEFLNSVQKEMGLFEGKGMSEQNISYRAITISNSDIPSDIRTSLNDQITKNFRNDLKEMWKGERSIRSYKEGMPVPFSKKSISNFQEIEKRNFLFSFFPSKFNNCKFMTNLGRDRSNNHSIICKLINGEYKLCDSCYSFDGMKLFFHLVISIPKENKNLDPNKILGIDLGIKSMIYYSDPEGAIHGQIGGNGALFREQRKFYQQKKSLQEQLSTSRGGRGRKHKLRPLDRLRNKEANFSSTWNHTYADQLIDVCIKNGIGTLKMENLKGLGSNLNKLFRHWPYFDLQTKIENKASRYGISVIKINPKFTSQTCHKCGNVDAGQREKRDIFVCKNEKCSIFGKGINADKNAAINIAEKVDSKIELTELVDVL